MLKRIFRIGLGVIFIILGIIGLFLPIVPGILLIFIGSAFIVNKNPKVLFREIVAKAKARLNKKCA